MKVYRYNGWKVSDKEAAIRNKLESIAEQCFVGIGKRRKVQIDNCLFLVPMEAKTRKVKADDREGRIKQLAKLVEYEQPIDGANDSQVIDGFAKLVENHPELQRTMRDIFADCESFLPSPH